MAAPVALDVSIISMAAFVAEWYSALNSLIISPLQVWA